MKFKAQNNTDSIDIDSECLGISVWVDGDSTNELNTKRGLHTQIRHNQHPETYKAAIQVQKLFVAAPKMHAILKELFRTLPANQDGPLMEEIEKILNATKEC